MLSTRLFTVLALSLLTAAPAAAGSLDFDFSIEEDDAYIDLSDEQPDPVVEADEVRVTLAADASLSERIWHDVGEARPCEGADEVACAGEALALLGWEARRAVYARALSERPEEDGADCIDGIEAAAGSSADEAAEMVEAVAGWQAAYVALRAERAALRDGLRDELQQAAALLDQLGTPEGEAILQRMSVLSDEVSEYSALLEEPLVVPRASGRAPESRAALDRLDGHIQGLSALAFQLRGVEAALKGAVPQS